MTDKKRGAIVKVSAELFLDALAVPDGTQLLGITWEPWPPTILLYLISPDLPEVAAGNALPTLTPVITADYDKRPSMWLTWDWNLKED